MKNKIAIILLAAAAVGAHATPVEIPLNSFFQSAKYTKAITIEAVSPWTTDGTNAFAGSTFVVTPAGGTNPVIDLKPNNYTLRVPDSRTPVRFTVPTPDSTNQVSILTLITNGLESYYNLGQFITGVAVSNSATVTWAGNGTVASPLVASASTNFPYTAITNPPWTTSDTVMTIVGGMGFLSNSVSSTNVLRITKGNSYLQISSNNITANAGGAGVIMTPTSFGYSTSHGVARLNIDNSGTSMISSNGAAAVSVQNGGVLFIGTLHGLTFTNAAGARFTLIVNSSTNGFTFVPVP